MRDLRLIGVHDDGEHLLVTDDSGEEYRLRIDEPLRAAARRDRPSETVDGEPFEVFDVLEPTTERELSPVLDAARLPPGAGGTTEAPIAWHAVHRKVIAGGEHTKAIGHVVDPRRAIGFRHQHIQPS